MVMQRSAPSVVKVAVLHPSHEASSIQDVDFQWGARGGPHLCF